jgi:hypothetical protein
MGIAFRLQGNRYEYICLRPSSGSAPDQIRRNHTTRCTQPPDSDFDRLRQESPEKYESYADLEPGVRTRYRIEVGTAARLLVHGAAQPRLVVNDLKPGDSEAAAAL